MNDEHVEISNCPKCKLSHRYKLKIERAMVTKMITMSNIAETERQVRITRIFTCPKENEQFEATFTLTDTSSNRIKKVEVAGIADEAEQNVKG